MLRALSFALFWAVSAGALAQSQQPPSNTPQQQAAPDERGTDKSPIVVKVMPATKPKEELDSEKARQESDSQLVELTGDLATYTKLLFFATGALVLATGFLVRVGYLQIGDARASIAAAVKSAAAAEKSADAVVSQLRPYIACDAVIRLGEEQPLLVTAKNSGQTAAFGFKMQVVSEFPYSGQTRNITDIPAPTTSQCDLPPGGGAQTRLPLVGFQPEQEVAVYVLVSYRDVFHKNRTVRFKFLGGGGYGFSPDGHMINAPDGNYETEDG